MTSAADRRGVAIVTPRSMIDGSRAAQSGIVRKRSGLHWWMARSARAAMTALRHEGVPAAVGAAAACTVGRPLAQSAPASGPTPPSGRGEASRLGGGIGNERKLRGWRRPTQRRREMEWIERLIARWRREAQRHLEAAREAEADSREDESAFHEQDARVLEQCARELESEWHEFAIR